jgi:hypothetical protein
MNTKINERAVTPTDIKSPVYPRPSETVRSSNDAGGEVSPSQYIDKAPQPTPEFLR